MGMCADGNCPECVATREQISSSSFENTGTLRKKPHSFIKGKLARKAAKRERVRAMKIAQLASV